MKAKFGAIAYTDLVFNGGTVTKSAWVLPADAQTEETGTLADFLCALGCEVDEVELDGGTRTRTTRLRQMKRASLKVRQRRLERVRVRRMTRTKMTCDGGGACTSCVEPVAART